MELINLADLTISKMQSQKKDQELKADQPAYPGEVVPMLKDNGDDSFGDFSVSDQPHDDGDGWTVVTSRRARQQARKNEMGSGCSSLPCLSSSRSRSSNSSLSTSGSSSSGSSLKSRPPRRNKAKLASAPDDEPPVPAYFRQFRHCFEMGFSAEKTRRIINSKPRVSKPRLKPQLPVYCLTPHVPDKVKQQPRRKRLDRSLKCYPSRSSSKKEKKRSGAHTRKPPLCGPPPRRRVEKGLRRIDKVMPWTNDNLKPCTVMIGRAAGASSRRTAGGAGGSQ